MTKLCVVIGNGPSLRGFRFSRLSNVATLGMNAAYRYWDQIGWYPTHYCCLDDQLIETHHNEIERLYATGKVETVFVHSRFFEHHPHRVGNKDFTSLDQVSEHWYNWRGKKQGLPKLYDLPMFLLSDPSKITTGSHAVRYAAYMGYDKIALMGIDLRYTEIIAEAVPTQGVGLKITETPKHNPNYFFDGYQVQGDLYNIPNPDVHDGQLHTRAFQLIPLDFEINDVQIEVVNTNPNSILNDMDAIRFEEIESVLDESKLGAVFVPTNVHEVPAILDNFALWARREFRPSFEVQMRKRVKLVFVFNNKSARGAVKDIEAQFEKYEMSRYFSGLEFEFLALEGERDLYERDYTKVVGDMGFKAGPNNQFFDTIKLMQPYGRYAFLMETDCMPIRKGWLSHLQKLVDCAEPFWVMGSAYRGQERLSKSFVRHVNGNAVYAVGDPAFQEFVDAFWSKHTWRLIRDVDKRLAYDCVLEIIFSEEGIREENRMDVWKSIAHKIRYTDYIQNISGNGDIAKSDLSLVDKLRRESPHSFLLHNRTVQKLALASLADDSSLPVRKVDKPAAARPAPVKVATYPQLLVIDMTAMDNGTATGDLKARLLDPWPDDAVLQVASIGEDKLGLVRLGSGGAVIRSESLEGIARAIDRFDPDIVLYRPVPNVPWLHKFAMDTINRLGKPLVSWVMDDWPAELAQKDPGQWAQLEPDFRDILRRSTARLSICDAMSKAFEARYGCKFSALANGILPREWPNARVHKAGGLKLRYAGGLAMNMTRDSVLRIARAVEILAREGIDVSFEINTQPWWHEESGGLFEGFEHTRIETTKRPGPEYRAWLRDADITVIAYNFDEATRRYVQYSMANKMPECLASGSVVLTHGPRGLATIDYLAETDAAFVISENSISAVVEALRKLHDDPARRNAISMRGRALAFSQHDLSKKAEMLRALLANAAASGVIEAERPAAHVPVPDPDQFLVRLARSIELAGRPNRDEVALFLRTFATALLLEPSAMLARAQPGSSLAVAIERALAELPRDDALRRHFESVSLAASQQASGNAGAASHAG